MNTQRANHIIVVSPSKYVEPAWETQNNGNIYLQPIPEAWIAPNKDVSLRPMSLKLQEIRNGEYRKTPSVSSAVSAITDYAEPSSKYNAKILKNMKPKTTNNAKNCSKIMLVVLGTCLGLCSWAALSVGIYSLVLASETSKNIATTNTSLGFRWYTTGPIVAGFGSPPGLASNQLYNPVSLAFGASNELYVADYYNNRIQKWVSGATAGITVAGQPDAVSGSTSIYLNLPAGIVLDSSDNRYVSDSANHRVQLWRNGSSSGTTIAGNGASSGTVAAGGNGAGPLTTQLYSPTGVYFDSSSNGLFITNVGANNIVCWVLSASGWTLVAGNPAGSMGSTPTLLYSSYGLTLDSVGNVYVADSSNDRIQFFSAGQTNATTIAGATGIAGATNQLLYYPYAVALDSTLNLIPIQLLLRNFVKPQPANGRVDVGHGIGCMFNTMAKPTLKTKPNGNVQVQSIPEAWITSTKYTAPQPMSLQSKKIRNGEYRKMPSGSSSVSVITDCVEPSSKNNAKNIKNVKIMKPNTTSSKMKYSKVLLVVLGSVAIFGSMGALSIGIYSLVTRSATSTNSSTTNTSLGLRWYTTGSIVAGLGGVHGSASNQLYSPISLALGASNELYVADYNNNRIQKWVSGGATGSTVAGQPDGVSGSTLFHLALPAGIVLDSSNNLYVSDSANHRVQLWLNGSSSGTTIAGTGTLGSSLAQLNTPRGLARGSSTGTLYIADSGNHRLMRYASGASSGTVAAGGNGAGPLTTQLYSPTGVYFDSSSNGLFIVNEPASTVVRWVLGATGWTLVAGHPAGAPGSTSTMLNRPYGLTCDPMGNLYVADTSNSRIQFFLAGQANATTIAGVTGTVGATGVLLYLPYAVALDSELNLYVADTSNQRVVKFTRY
ncbi:unnamed protein product [Rotaria socialis]|uniref:NHL repeat containing protein n=1 Tax=Rotaria socialis TaxID=392032 RepID=A0A820HLF6_9BILA|nr:unnamed protein product [Rotaria socialis]